MVLTCNFTSRGGRETISVYQLFSYSVAFINFILLNFHISISRMP